MREPTMACRCAGFTLSELMVAVTLTGLLTGLAVPSFRTLLSDNARITAGNEMRAGAQLARSTAISLNRRVSFCAGSPEAGCHGDWNAGEWMVFDDRDADGQVDTEERIYALRREALSGTVQISRNGPFANRVVFTPAGTAVTRTGAFAAGRIRLCTTTGDHGEALELVLIGSGRMESETRSLPGGCVPL